MSMSPPIPSYGTTNIGVATVRFLILAVDKRVTKDGLWHPVVDADDDKKLFQVSSVSNIYITAAGSVRAWDELYKFLQEAVGEEELKTRRPATVDFVKKMVEKHMNTGAASWKNDVYAGIIAGWPMGGVGMMLQFHIQKNKAYFAEIAIRDYGIAGSGATFASSYLQNYLKPDVDSVVAGKRCLEGIFKAAGKDPSTGGGGVVGCFTCLEEGNYTLLYDCNALQTYSHTFDADSKRVLFLFVPCKLGDDLITIREIRRDCGLIKVSYATMMAVTKSFAFYRIELMTEKDLERAIEKFSLPTDEPDLQQVASISDFLSTLSPVTIHNIECHISKASRSIIQLVERLQREENAAQV